MSESEFIATSERLGFRLLADGDFEEWGFTPWSTFWLRNILVLPDRRHSVSDRG